MTDNNKDLKRKAFYLTAGTNILFFLMLMIIVAWKETYPPPEEYGIELGTDNIDISDVNNELEDENELEFNAALLKKVDELELSVRSANCLKNDNIVYIGDLILKSENEMLRTPNFGRKSLNEIKEVLTEMGLSLGMDVPTWPPENVDELARKASDKF